MIVALIAINALLGWTLYNERKIVELDQIDQDLIVDLLADKYVAIDKNIIDVNQDIENVNLNLQVYDEEFVSSILDNHNDYTDNRIVAQPIEFPQKGEIFYQASESVFLESTVLSDDEIINQAYMLLDELKISKEDVYLRDIGYTGTKVILEFGQKYNDRVIRDSFLTVIYNNKNLLSFRRVWYDVEGTGTREKTFNSPEYALYDFVRIIYNKNPNRERTLEIVDIQLVYQLNTDEEGTAVVEGEANIFYEITTSDGETYLVNAIAK